MEDAIMTQEIFVKMLLELSTHCMNEPIESFYHPYKNDRIKFEFNYQKM